MPRHGVASANAESDESYISDTNFTVGSPRLQCSLAASSAVRLLNRDREGADTSRRFSAASGSPRHSLQRRYRRAPASRFQGRVAERLHERSRPQYLSDDLPLYTDSAPVNDSNRLEPQPMSFIEVLLDNHLHIPRRDRVKIEDVGDRKPDWFFGH